MKGIETMEEKDLDQVTEQKFPRRQPLRQFKKCKSATFTLDGMNYTIGMEFYNSLKKYNFVIFFV